jgi:hypothetical protein
LALSSLLELREDTRHVWRPEELGAIWKHQLTAPMPLALGDSLSAEVMHELEMLELSRKNLKNLDELLHGAQPAIGLLNLVKRFAKQCWSDRDGPLPREIAALLYYASIAVADLRLGKRISELRSDELIQGLRWSGTPTWVDEQTRQLLKEALTRMGQGAGDESKSVMPLAPD